MTAAVESPAERSPWWLAFRVFDEPGQVFTELAERPRALVPVVLLLVATFGMAMGIPTPVIQNGIRRQFDALEQRRPGAIPPEVRERALAQAGAMGGRVRNSLIGSAALVIFLAIGAAILSLIFNSISGTEIGFKDQWAIVTHACMP